MTADLKRGLEDVEERTRGLVIALASLRLKPEIDREFTDQTCIALRRLIAAYTKRACE